MLNFSPEKLFLVGVIALIVLGPHRLPQAARTLGRLVAELRRMSSTFQDEVRGALAEPTEAVTSAVGEFRPPNISKAVRDTITATLSPPAVTQTENSIGIPGVSEIPPSPDDPSLN